MFKFLAAALAAWNATGPCASDMVFQDVQVALQPEPPVAGQNATLQLQYTVPSDVAGGTATYAYTLNGLPLPGSSNDLCQDVECPVSAGAHAQESTSEWPAFSGKLDMTMTWTDLEGNVLLCVQVVERQSV